MSVDLKFVELTADVVRIVLTGIKYVPKQFSCAAKPKGSLGKRFTATDWCWKWFFVGSRPTRVWVNMG